MNKLIRISMMASLVLASLPGSARAADDLPDYMSCLNGIGPSSTGEGQFFDGQFILPGRHDPAFGYYSIASGDREAVFYQPPPGADPRAFAFGIALNLDGSIKDRKPLYLSDRGGALFMGSEKYAHVYYQPLRERALR